MISRIIKIANVLDQSGYTKEADVLTKVAENLVKEAFDTGIPVRDFPGKPDEDLSRPSIDTTRPFFNPPKLKGLEGTSSDYSTEFPDEESKRKALMELLDKYKIVKERMPTKYMSYESPYANSEGSNPEGQLWQINILLRHLIDGANGETNPEEQYWSKFTFGWFRQISEMLDIVRRSVMEVSTKEADKLERDTMFHRSFK